MARYYYDHAYVWANRGNLYGFPMHTETAEPTILENESSVAALAPVSTGAVVGLTCGRRAHLFYFHFAYGVVDLGLLSETPVAGGALVRTHGDTVLAGWHAGGSGGLARHDAAREMGTGQEDFRPPVGAVHRMATPGAEGVLALAYDRKRGVAYGLTCANRIISLSDGAARLRTELRTELTPAPVLAVLPDGRLLGAGQEGRLWEREPGAKRLHVLDAWAPCQKGKRYVAGVQSLLVASSGRVYGGTSTDGYLFSYNPVSGRLVNLGKPDRQSVIRCLAEGRDGTLYGIVQEPGGMAHLFSFDPEAREFEDRGVIGSSFPVQWNAWSIGAMGVGEQGELYLGEDDSIGHLFVYHPPVPARKVQK
jgi:hypothetical protein